MAATKELPFGMLHQEDPSIELLRGYNDDNVVNRYNPETQINENFKIMMARTWSRVTSTGWAIDIDKDADEKEDDKT